MLDSCLTQSTSKSGVRCQELSLRFRWAFIGSSNQMRWSLIGIVSIASIYPSIAFNQLIDCLWSCSDGAADHLVGCRLKPLAQQSNHDVLRGSFYRNLIKFQINLITMTRSTIHMIKMESSDKNVLRNDVMIALDMDKLWEREFEDRFQLKICTS